MAITVASQLMVEILDFPRWILRHLGTQEAQKKPSLAFQDPARKRGIFVVDGQSQRRIMITSSEW